MVGLQLRNKVKLHRIASGRVTRFPSLPQLRAPRTQVSRCTDWFRPESWVSRTINSIALCFLLPLGSGSTSRVALHTALRSAGSIYGCNTIKFRKCSTHHRDARRCDKASLCPGLHCDVRLQMMRWISTDVLYIYPYDSLHRAGKGKTTRAKARLLLDCQTCWAYENPSKPKSQAMARC